MAKNGYRVGVVWHVFRVRDVNGPVMQNSLKSSELQQVPALRSLVQIYLASVRIEDSPLLGAGGRKKGLDHPVIGCRDDLADIPGGLTGSRELPVPGGRLLLRLRETGPHNLPSPLVQLFWPQPLGVPPNAFVDRMRIPARLPVDWQEVVHPHEHQRRLRPFQQLPYSPVYLPKVPQDVVLWIVRLVTVKDRGPPTPPPGRAGVKLELLLLVVVSEGVGQTLGDVFQLNLSDAMTRRPEKSHLILAEGEYVELPVAGQEG